MDKAKRAFRSFLCICLALGMFLLGPGRMPYAKATNIEDLQDEYNQLEQQIAANKKKLNAIASDMENQQAYIDTLNAQVEATQKQADVLQERIGLLNSDISSLNRQIESLNTKITQTQAKADDQQKQIEETFELLKKRMRAMYMSGGGTQLEFLLEAGDFETFLTRTELLRGVAKHDTELANQLSEELEEFNKLIKSMELAVFAQRVSLRGDGDAAGHLAAGDTDALALHLRVDRLPHRHAVAPAVADVYGSGGAPHHLFGPGRETAQRVDVVADEAEFDGRVRHGRELEERRAQPHVGKIRGDIGVETLLDGLGLPLVVQFDEDVAEIGTQRLPYTICSVQDCSPS